MMLASGRSRVPTYTFRRKSTGDEWTETMKIAEMEEMLAADPDVQYVPGGFAYCDSWLVGVTKPSDGFRDVLKDIKRRNPGSTIKTY
jgi:hypothetical protein